jgi:ATP-dependent exoDNAse (exonuclease V) beta subunit
MKGFMDRLNLMYVAFTRARDMLYMGIPRREARGLKNTGDLWQAILHQEPEKQPCTGILAESMEGRVLSLGEMPVYELTPEKEDPWRFQRYPVNRGGRQLKIHLRSDQYFLDEEGVYRTGRMYGNLMHQLFSLIDTVDDVDRAVAQLQREGLLPEKERTAMLAHVREIIGRKEVSAWFPRSGSASIFKERSLLCGSGEVLRPDRVVVEGERATVIDFKFGESERASHHQQVGEYMKQLSLMGFKQVEGYLWYVVLDRIIKIETP